MVTGVEGSLIRREYPITLGRLEGHGRRAMPMKADYALVYRNTKLAVVEAKARDEEVTEGVGQAKQYAEKLAVPFAFSTNGRGIYGINMQDGTEGEIDRFPTPEELWNRTFTTPNVWRDRFAEVAFEDRGGFFQPRYYQEIAIQRVLEAMGLGTNRILLTLATGTGKTAIGFQISWKLFYSRWNLGDWNSQNEPTRRPRILFLADRNILADQAVNTFSPFPEDAVVRIDPDIIRRKGRVPKNGNVFFTIFQTFMTGPAGGDSEPWFYAYPPDFFDFIVIDECHRGGANDESVQHEAAGVLGVCIGALRERGCPRVGSGEADPAGTRTSAVFARPWFGQRVASSTVGGLERVVGHLEPIHLDPGIRKLGQHVATAAGHSPRTEVLGTQVGSWRVGLGQQPDALRIDERGQLSRIVFGRARARPAFVPRLPDPFAVHLPQLARDRCRFAGAQLSGRRSVRLLARESGQSSRSKRRISLTLRVIIAASLRSGVARLMHR